MDLKAVLTTLQKSFDAAGVHYALIGGLAVGGLGYQRFTNDVDLLIHEDDREKAKAALLAQGYKVFSESDEFIQFEGACPVDLQVARRPISKRMLADAQVLPGLSVKCLRAEDIIGLKIQSYATNPKREFKEKADIQALAERRGARLDWNRIKEYAELFAKWPEIEAIKKRASSD